MIERGVSASAGDVVGGSNRGGEAAETNIGGAVSDTAGEGESGGCKGEGYAIPSIRGDPKGGANGEVVVVVVPAAAVGDAGAGL